MNHFRRHIFYERILDDIFQKKIRTSDEEFVAASREIVATCRRIHGENRDHGFIYNNIFGLITNRDITAEDSLVKGACNTMLHWAYNNRGHYSQSIIERYNRYEAIQPDIDRMIELLSGKTLVQIHKEWSTPPIKYTA